jgi:hypothetical protein
MSTKKLDSYKDIEFLKSVATFSANKLVEKREVLDKDAFEQMRDSLTQFLDGFVSPLMKEYEGVVAKAEAEERDQAKHKEEIDKYIEDSKAEKAKAKEYVVEKKKTTLKTELGEVEFDMVGEFHDALDMVSELSGGLSGSAAEMLKGLDLPTGSTKGKAKVKAEVPISSGTEGESEAYINDGYCIKTTTDAEKTILGCLNSTDIDILSLDAGGGDVSELSKHTGIAEFECVEALYRMRNKAKGA